MKLLRNLPSHTPGISGQVKLLTHDSDDMWNLYNMITIGDIVASKTTRKLVKNHASGSSSSERLTIGKLPILVTSVDWDGSTNQIRISGTVCEEIGGRAGEGIKKGQFHTLQLEPNETVYITKDPWDAHDLDQLRTATSQYKDVSAAALVMHMGLAHVCLITRTIVSNYAKIELSIPKKRAIGNQQSQIDKFFTYVAETLSQLPTSISCFIIASPAFVGIDFFTFLQAKYADKYKWLFPITRKIHAPSGHKHSLLEALADGSLGNILTDSGLDTERAAMAEFLTTLSIHPFRAYYGLRDVTTLVNEHGGAIQTLLMLDSLFKDQDPIQRRSFVELTESVKHNGGNVIIFSSLNPTAEQLKQITGLACILHYDIEDLQNDQEYIALEDFINTALDISPLQRPMLENHYTYASNTHPDQLSDFICLPNGFPANATEPALISHELKESPSVKEKKKDKKDKKSDKKSDKKHKKSSSKETSSPESLDLGLDCIDGVSGVSDVAGGSKDRYEDLGDFF